LDAAGRRIRAPRIWPWALFLLLLSFYMFNVYAQSEGDLDGDGLPDDWEALYGVGGNTTDDGGGDPDVDGLNNTAEYKNGTDPTSSDTDGDGMEDGWEVENDLLPLSNDSGGDPDKDNLTNLEEYENGTDPGNYDTDGDGMDDGWEVRYDLDPLYDDADEDYDNDGFTNYEEYLGDDREQPEPIAGDSDDSSDPWDIFDFPRWWDGAGSGEKEDATGATSLCFLFLFLVGVIVVVLLMIGFYTKLRRDRLLDHETRERIVEYLRVNPGAHYSAMAKDLELPHGVLTHHINMLETQEMVFSKQDRSYRRFFLDGMSRQGPLVTGLKREVLRAIRKNPGSTQAEIARYLEMSRMKASYHINSLEELGLVERIERGREKLVYPKGPEPARPESFDEAPRAEAADAA